MKEPHPHHFDASIGTTMDVIVSADNVTRDYDLGKVRVHALRGVTLYVGRGEFLSVAGPSGSGKTTLLNLIGCVDTPTSGAVRIDGRDTRALSERELTKLRLHKIGFIFQSFNLISVLSLQQNVEFPLLLQGGLTRAERRKRVEELLAAVGLRKATYPFATWPPISAPSPRRSTASGWSRGPPSLPACAGSCSASATPRCR